MQTDLELFQRRQGIRAGSLIQGMKPFLFETVDYTAFLRMFAVENEVLQISDEKFDPIYYTYGLQKYGNISSASVPILLDNVNNHGMMRKGMKIVLAGFGAGLTWGATVINW